MRNFLTSMLGTMAGLTIFFVGSVLLCFGLLIGLAASSQGRKATGVEPGSYLVLDLRMNITDSPPPFDGGTLLQALNGGKEGTHTLQLRDLLRALKHAESDGNIRGLFIEGELQPSGYGTGFATLRELRAAISSFRESGKPVLSYLNSAGLRDYYIASAANDVVLDPYGEVALTGLSISPVFLSGTFEKYGVGVQVARVGKFKSAIEPYVRRDMSPEAREQMQVLLDDLWKQMRGDLATSRQLSHAQIQALADSEAIVRADQALEAKLVTRLQYRDEVVDELKSRTGRVGSERDFKATEMIRYIKQLPQDAPSPQPGQRRWRTDDRIAIVYAEGAIVEGEGGPDEVGGERFAEQLRRLREDDNVKAIVLRVNSPGGSVGASEHIQREIRLAKKVKPVVVSMGSYAASGGYWISAYANRIFAENTTLTGSIGVFGVFFNFQQLANNFGLSFDRVMTARKADIFSPARPKTAEEMAVFERSVQWVYGEFVGKVAEARGLSKERVDQIAQGRVWSGATALKLGLVDEIGGLEQAVAWAAKEAKMKGEPSVEEYPRKRGLEEMIAEALQQFSPEQSRAGISGKVIKQLEHEAKVIDQYNDPKGLYARLPFELIVN